ncbi:MAG TPA: acyl-CoA dehydrogenase family protein [Chloroflexota bacterium]|nr:acyl-CoA dehydrogenase family protein [Chloroflexota bacterium]
MASTLLRDLQGVEAAREEARAPSFMTGLFAGEPDLSLIVPFPVQSPEEKRIGDEFCVRVEGFLREHVDPAAIERTGCIPRDVIDGLADLGAFGMVIPREYGGLGFSQTNYDRVLMLVASYCNVLALVLSVHQSIGVARPIMLFGTEEQKRRWLPRLARGALSAFGLTEPLIGSDPANMRTTAERQPDGSYLINGEKLWTTNGPIAEVMVLTAKVDGRVTAFIVETASPGVEVLHRCEFMGCRGIENGWLRFTNVRVPPENVLGPVGKGLRIALTLLNVGRVSVAAICLGMAKQLLPPTVAWANQRMAFGKPIGQHELNAQKIARMAADVFAMEALVALVAGMVDRGGCDFRAEAAAAKLVCSERLWRVCDSALQIHGGRGYETAASRRARGERDAAPIEQVFRDARLYLIGEGASEILKLFIAREVWDPHLKRAAPFFESHGPEKLAEAGKLARFYAGWYAERLIPHRDRHRPAEPVVGGAAGWHLDYVRTTSRRLARAGFELMVRHRAGLEQRQAQVARLAAIGVELFTLAAVAGYLPHRPGSEPLAEQVYRDCRRTIEACFRAIRHNDDGATTRLGRGVLAGSFDWLTHGAVGPAAGPPGTADAPLEAVAR